MEADWEIEIGPEFPMIDAHWPGYVDLRQTPAVVQQLPEVALLQGLDEALIRLNGMGSPVWTAKCDVWQLATDEFDADEMDATLESATCGRGLYIDLLSTSGQQWTSPAMAISWCKGICGLLKKISIPCCRVDMIIRQGAIAPDGLDTHMELGITAYLTSCGPTSLDANLVLQAALNRFVDALCGPSTVE